jgi:nitrite reductase/ring-hydroxylating ferredoxin subunit
MAAGGFAAAAGRGDDAGTRRAGNMLSLKWHRLMRESEIIPDQVQIRKVFGRLVGITNVNGCIYVFDGRCPHAGRSLQDSVAAPSGVVVCATHGFRLSLYPQPCAVKAIPLTRFAFRICNGYVELDRQSLLRDHAPVELGVPPR